MSLAVGRSKLVGSLKELMVKWDRTKEHWDDPMSRTLEERVLLPLEPKIRAAATAMEKMGEVLARARRECE
jgi:hypothetical protein